ncbi:MAG: hypothetical protein NC132_06980, partial [Corallococcus sp.]|nr:hypothetical protein [Corallococcus sp.]
INNLGGVDIAFFIICAVIVVAIVGIYFLIPVFNKKQYQEQRENLRKREEAFKSNATKKAEEITTAEDAEIKENDESSK